MKRNKNEQGMAMVLVLLIMVVGVVLITAMLAMSRAENEQAIDQTENMKAYYIARAGADAMVYRLKTLPKPYWDSFTTTTLETNDITYGDGSFNVSVKRTGEDFAVTSTGKYRDTQQQVTAVLKHYNNTKLIYAVYSDDSMSGLSLKNLAGNVGSGGTIDYGNEADTNKFGPKSLERVPMSLSINVPDMSAFANTPVAFALSTTASTCYSSADVKNNKTWRIDTSNAEYNIPDPNNPVLTNVGSGNGSYMVVQVNGTNNDISGNLEVTGNKNLILVVNGPMTIGSALKLTGSGSVEVYVNDTTADADDFDLVINSSDSKDIINTSLDSDRLKFYLKTGTRMQIGNNPTIYGFIAGPDAYVEVANGNSIFNGAIYAGLVSIDSSSTINYQQPDDNTIRLESIQFAYWQ